MARQPSGLWIVAIPAGRWQLSGIHAAHNLGLKVLGIDGNADAAGVSACDEFLCCQVDDLKAQLRFIQRMNLKVASAVSFTSDVGIVPAARLRRALGCPGTPVEVSERLVNKELQRLAYLDAGVPSVSFSCHEDRESAIQVLSSSPVSYVVKPVDASGSRGVSVLGANGGEAAILEAVDLAFAHSKVGRILTEEFVAGVEHTVELAGSSGLWHTLAVTEKGKPLDSKTVSNSLTSIDLQSEKALRIQACAKVAADSLGLKDGIVHAEIMWSPERGPVVIELAGRGGGFMLNDRLVPVISGVDPSQFAVLSALGRVDSVPASLNRPASIAFLPSSPGIIKNLALKDSTNADQSVVVELLVDPGDNTETLIGDGQRVACAIATSSSFDDVRLLATKALESVEVIYE